MKLTIPQYTYLLITLLVVSCQDKQEAEVISSTNKLLTAYYKTVGGYNNIKAIETKIIDGHYITPGYNLLLKAHQEYKRLLSF